MIYTIKKRGRIIKRLVLAAGLISESLFAQAQGPCITLNNSPSTDRNRITVTTPRINSYSPGGSYTNCQVMQTIQYYDGLGRPSQTVQQKASPQSYDIVQPIEYDQFGREAKKYLPYTLSTSGNGNYRTAAVTEQNSFYVTPPTGVTAVPNTAFSQTLFEPSPLNRITEQGAPGATWQTGTGHTVRVTYSTNAANETKKWNVYVFGASDGGFYPANTLTVSTTLDENSKATVEYKDKQGRTVCKKVQSDSGYASTYYIYDDRGNLAFVIPPLPTGVSLPASFDGSSPTFNSYIYGYQYDDRNRVVEKHMPGKGWDYIVYNKMNLVVATQDDVQRLKSTQQWTFMRYDGLGRLTQSGIYNHAGSTPGLSYRNDVQIAVNTSAIHYDTYTGAGTYGYNQIAWPANSAIAAYLTINYYGRYDVPGNNPYLNPVIFTPLNSTTPVKFMASPDALTVSRTRVLLANGNLTGPLLWSANHYDDKGRLAQAFSQHYLNAQNNTGNYDRIDNSYNFNGDLIQSIRSHYVAGTNTLLVTTGYIYDHMGRKLRTTSKVGTNAEVTLSRLTYNETGQVREKSLHGNASDVFLQNIAYTYNPRGWLRTSSSPLFAMQLNYNEESSNQFNGNISKQYWGVPGNLNKNYVYTYDSMNRLTSGVGSMGNSETGITYDDAGNLLTLTRLTPGTTKNYAYNYDGNRLTSVTGLSSNSYQYDASGKMTFDARNNTNVAYNLLNLPRNISGKSLTYVYDASGRKLQRKIGTVTTDYVDGIQYDGGTLTFIQTEEGRILNLTGTPNYEYSLKDHLGNSRVTFDSSTGAVAKQTDDYFPFGMVASQTGTIFPENKYLYNSKELQDGIGQYDYGARFYDPVIARFTTIDRFAEKYQFSTPYHYGLNNPISNIDMNGDSVWTTSSQVRRNGNTYVTRTTHITGKVLDMTGNGGADALASGLNARLNSSTASRTIDNADGSKTYISYNIDAQFSAAYSADDVGKGDNVVAIIDKMLGKSADGVTNAGGITNKLFGLVSYVAWTNPRNVIDGAYHEIGHQFGLGDYFDGDKTSPMDYNGGSIYGGTRFNNNEMFYIWENNGGLYDIRSRRGPNTAIITNRQNTGVNNERSTNERPYRGPRRFGMRILLPIKNNP